MVNGDEDRLMHNKISFVCLNERLIFAPPGQGTRRRAKVLTPGLPEAGLLRLECLCESPGDLVKMHALIPWVWVEPKILMF